ncbi:MAG: hypothetical protein DBY20_06700 [Coriobacteriia bacterium]|nr:MAG: hypothetical protein DBY20_06700 [Coriobacteriia bacterium]HJI99537.1 MucBP domain-containing protein [Coriobacteriaceae bacterium]
MTAAKHTMRHLGAALFGVVLTLLLALCMGLPAAAFAAPDDTTYTIRLYGGNRGTVNGQDMVEWTGVHYGDTVDLGQANITVTDGKYYAKGARPAGLDNVKDVVYVADVDANGKLSGTVTVTEDADYVIAYGVLADRVEYTVRYVDAAGNELAASQKFMGDIGDTPATAAPYFENYVPNAYTATLALTGDPDQNVITFTYARLATGYTTEQNGDGTIDVVTPTGDRVALTPSPATSLPAAAVTAGTAESAQSVVAPDGTEVMTEDGTPLSAPIESLTITDDETPLSSADDIAQANAASSAWNNWVSIALIAGAVVLLVVAFVLWRRNRRKEDF